MKLNWNQSIVVAIILSATLLGIVALVRNTNIKLNINFGEQEKSLNIEGKSTRDYEVNNCLSNKENNYTNCDEI